MESVLRQESEGEGRKDRSEGKGKGPRSAVARHAGIIYLCTR